MYIICFPAVTLPWSFDMECRRPCDLERDWSCDLDFMNTKWQYGSVNSTGMVPDATNGGFFDNTGMKSVVAVLVCITTVSAYHILFLRFHFVVNTNLLEAQIAQWLAH